MRFKRVIAGLWTAALLSGAAALAADSEATLAALRLSAAPDGPGLQAPELRAAGPRTANTGYATMASVPALRPSIFGRTVAEGGAQIQLGAYRHEADADEDWQRLFAKAGGLLAGLTPEIVAVDLPARGRFYRLRVGPLAGGGAEALCARLKARGLPCIPAKD